MLRTITATTLTLAALFGVPATSIDLSHSADRTTMAAQMTDDELELYYRMTGHYPTHHGRGVEDAPTVPEIDIDNVCIHCLPPGM